MREDEALQGPVCMLSKHRVPGTGLRLRNPACSGADFVPGGGCLTCCRHRERGVSWTLCGWGSLRCSTGLGWCLVDVYVFGIFLPSLLRWWEASWGSWVMATLAAGGFFQPRQLLHKDSGSLPQLHKESSSKRSESSKDMRSPSSHSSISGSSSYSGSADCSSPTFTISLLGLPSLYCWHCIPSLCFDVSCTPPKPESEKETQKIVRLDKMSAPEVVTTHTKTNQTKKNETNTNKVVANDQHLCFR